MDGHRHELKYYINQGEALLLSKRLGLTMDRDRHANDRGEYSIRSLYFDDALDTSIAQKLAGDNERRKYRIRIYNLSDEVIRLERKEKSGQAIRKASLRITREQCEALCRGNAAFLLRYDHPLAMDMYYQLRGRLLRPAVIVDYVREAYVHPVEDVRITLDKGLRTGVFSKNLFDRRLPTVQVLEDYDMILEVKFNESLPAYFRELIQLGSAQRSAASKYVMCRKFE